MDELKRFRGQYLREEKGKKPKPHKGNELQHISLCTFNHNGKIANHGGAQ